MAFLTKQQMRGFPNNTLKLDEPIKNLYLSDIRIHEAVTPLSLPRVKSVSSILYKLKSENIIRKYSCQSFNGKIQCRVKMTTEASEIQAKDLPWQKLNTNQLVRRAEDDTPITTEEMIQMVIKNRTDNEREAGNEDMEHDGTEGESQEEQSQQGEETRGEKSKEQRNYKRALQFTPTKSMDTKHQRTQDYWNKEATQNVRSCKYNKNKNG